MAKIIKEKTPIPEQDPKIRRQNFNEVALGYSEEDALREASRCLGCKDSPCLAGCPVEIDIPAFISLIKERDYLGAVRKIKEKNALPAICGRVCPQETQCEQYCTLGKRFEPVAIGRLERFVADYEMVNTKDLQPITCSSPNGKSIAVVGSGPAGLTAAADLAKLDYKVTIFEALHKTGGVLVYGIPEFRLPKAIVEQEVEFVKRLGVELKLSVVIGRTLTIDDLFSEGYDAIFVGVGAGLPHFMDIPGENLNGVYSANEYLTRVNLMKAYLFPEYDTPIKKGKRVAVVGGGNVAMDAARTALRLGADQVFIIYRRSQVEMPARREEVHHAEEEGIEFKTLTNPTRIIGDKQGWVKEIECIRMELGEPDDSGRRRPIPIEGSLFKIEVDIVVMAIGNGANPLLTSATPDMAINKWGYIITDDEGRTTKKGVYAGGDIVTGSATVISAMGAGKRAVRAIHKDLTE
ncbi:TPA: glutamate synthase (NADPH), homotetrameric [bacterium]|nr:glutamate synthase (NADPH), homotetrameric [bacterium]